MPDLVGGPFDGEAVAPMGRYCYVVGSARRQPGEAPVIRVARASPSQMLGVTEQHVYRWAAGHRRYEWLMELDDDGG